MVRGETDKTEATSWPDHLWPELRGKMGKNAKLREKHKWALKNQSSIMQEDYEESILLTLSIWTSRKSLRMPEENWKHQWLQQCLARHARKTSTVRPVVNPMRTNQNLRVFWKPVNPQDCIWKNLHQNIMRTILQERGQSTAT